MRTLIQVMVMVIALTRGFEPGEKARKRPSSPPLYSTPPHGYGRTTGRTGSPPETPPWVTALMVVLALKAEKPENRRVYFMEERPHE